MSRPKTESVPIPEAQSVYYSDDGTASVVLEDIYDPNYSPTNEELIDYASWLGMDPDEDEPLMWIAEQGLKSPLPENWRPCKTDNGDVYYFNFRTGESIWDHPLDPKFKALYKREKQKMMEKKPFKTKMDDEVREFLTGEPANKKKKSNKSNDGKSSAPGGNPGGKKGSGLPSTLTNALKKAAEKEVVKDNKEEATTVAPARGKGKFGNLPANPLAKVGKPILGSGGGLRPIEEEEKGTGSSALGKQALPGLGGLMEKGSPLTSTLKTPSSLLGKPSFDDQGEKDALEDSFKSELDTLRKEHKRLLEEARRAHEQETKQLKYTQEQDLQDLEMEFNKQKNAAKRRNATKQSEWERELDEQQLSNRRKYEKELVAEFEQWKQDKEQMHKSQKERQELLHKEDLELLKTKKDDMLRKLKREHETQIEEKQSEWEEKKEALDKQERDLSKRREGLTNARSELESKEVEIKQQLVNLKEKEKENETRRKELETMSSSEDFTALSAQNNKEVQDLLAEHAGKMEDIKHSTREEVEASKADHERELEALKAKHVDNQKQLQAQCEAKKAELEAEQERLEEALKQKRDELDTAANNLAAETEGLQGSTISERRQALAAELEEELAETKRRHAQEKQAIEDILKAETEKLNARRAEVERKTNELREQENEQEAKRRELEEANRSHEAAMEALKRDFEAEAAKQRESLEEEHTARMVAEKNRLEQETRSKLVDLTNQNEVEITLKRQQEEARIQKELTELKLAGEREKKAFLEKTNAEHMKLESSKIDAKIEEYKAQEQARLNSAMRGLEDDMKEKERAAKQRFDTEMAVRLQQYQASEEERLVVAFGASKNKSEALAVAQADLDEELRVQRAAFEDKLKALADEYERKNFEMRREAEEIHDAKVEKFMAKHNKQLELLENQHTRELREMKGRHERHLVEQRTAEDYTERFASEKKALEETHVRQLSTLRKENAQQLSTEQSTHSRRLEEIKEANAVQLSEMRVKEHERQMETVKEKVRHRAADKISQASDSDNQLSYNERHRKHEKKTRHKQQHQDKDNIRQAKQFLKKHKKRLKDRQEHLRALRAKWEGDLEELRRGGKKADTSVLKQAKKRLDQQAEELNMDVKQLVNGEYWLTQRIKKQSDWEVESCVSSSLSSMTPTRPRTWGTSSRQSHYAEPGIILSTLSSLQNQVKHLTDQLNQFRDPYSSRPHSRSSNHHIITEWSDWLRQPKQAW